MILRNVTWTKARGSPRLVYKRLLINGQMNYVAQAALKPVEDFKGEPHSHDREFIVSVLEAAVTKRDATSYLKTFAPPEPILLASRAHDKQAISNMGQAARPADANEASEATALPHVALVKLRNPFSSSQDVLERLVKTLTLLRTLGMLSVIVIDCDAGAKADILDQAHRLATIINSFGNPGAQVVDAALAIADIADVVNPPFTAPNISVESPDLINGVLRWERLPIVPPIAYTLDTQTARVVNADDVLLALTRNLSEPKSSGLVHRQQGSGKADAASVDRIIILDELGGTPATNRPNGVHIFINVEQEFKTIKGELEGRPAAVQNNLTELGKGHLSLASACQRHIDNLILARSALAMLPPSASAIITTPEDAAYISPEQHNDTTALVRVGTRRRQNPLIHNLLANKPMYSSSLPHSRMNAVGLSRANAGQSGPRPPLTTFVKRGMPVKILPEPAQSPWLPPEPGRPSLRLTDRCVDLPRLVGLLEDSFNHKLAVDHYLNRVNERIANIIVAGAYDGGAILTWEVPPGLTYEEAYVSDRLVPYLDKFAVLKRNQGSGGVADMVFSAIVRDCFPGGVCWRSRKDNIVNKWYFERSTGSYKLAGVNWTMFWTTPSLVLNETRFLDYERVCRSIESSWADQQRNIVT